jgi:hypothetical protein
LELWQSPTSRCAMRSSSEIDRLRQEAVKLIGLANKQTDDKLANKMRELAQQNLDRARAMEERAPVSAQ